MAGKTIEGFDLLLGLCRYRWRLIQRWPTASAHPLMVVLLTRQFLRQSNIVRPTSDDIRIAKTNAKIELKRADLEYRKREEERERKLASARRI